MNSTKLLKLIKPYESNSLIREFKESLREAQKSRVNQTATIVPRDWTEFAKLLDIRSGDRLIKMSPYPYQTVLCRLLDTYSNVCILKTRQIGVSEFVYSYFLHKATQNQAYSAAVFNLDSDMAKNASDRTRLMAKSLNLKTKNENISELCLKDGGNIYYLNSNPDGSRSQSLSAIAFDESAFSKQLERQLLSSTASLTMASKPLKVFITTPGSTSSHFFTNIINDPDNISDLNILEISNQVARGELYCDFPGIYYYSPNEETVHVYLTWLCIPQFAKIDKELKEQGDPMGYLSYRKKKNQLSQIILLRDYFLTWLSGEEAVFSTELVETALRGNWEEPKHERNSRYIAGLDTSTVGSNWLVWTVIKEDLVSGLLSLVCMYRQRRKSQEYHIYEISQLIRKYKIEKVGIESNHVGSIYLERLLQTFPDTNIKGYDTTTQSKPHMVGRLLSALERELLELPDDNTIRKELLNFSQIGNSYEAIAGNDDIVMSLCICLQVSQLATIPPKPDPYDGFSKSFIQNLWGEDE